MFKLSVLSLSLLIGSVHAFSPMAGQNVGTKLSMSADDNVDSRRSFFTKSAGSAAIAALSLVNVPEPAQAIGGALKKVNAKLIQYGVPPIKEVPSGFSPLAEVWGKGKNRDPLLVSFLHPVDWVVTLPSQDVNGEDGTIQAGEYAKGDTATFFVYTEEGKIDSISSQPKAFFERALVKSISQKGNNVYQDFKVTKINPQTIDGNEYMICDFKYSLLTGAGFEVDRVGVASVTSVGNDVELLWSASTRQRYRKTEEQLRTIAGSFRCYADGLDMAKIEYAEYD